MTNKDFDTFRYGNKYQVTKPWKDIPNRLFRISILCYEIGIGDIVTFRGPNLGKAEFITADGKLLILNKRTAFSIMKELA